MSFNDLKKQSSLGALTQKLVKEVEKMNTTSGGADERPVSYTHLTLPTTPYV